MTFPYETYDLFQTFIWNFQKSNVLLDLSFLKDGGFGLESEF